MSSVLHSRPSDRAIRAAIRRLGYPQPTSPAVVALRQSADPGAWNDLIGAFGGGASAWAEATTDPGRQPMEGTGRIPVNPGGVARVSTGFYRGVFEAGFHHSRSDHPALTQVRSRPLPVERWDRDAGCWRRARPAVGRFNLHRARWQGEAAVVGDYSHGCLVVRDRLAHWKLLLALGYPEHGPQTDTDRARRWDLYLLDWDTVVAASVPASGAGSPSNRQAG